MTTFGIISEGITDQIVIENILMGCFQDIESDDIAQLQPQRKKGEESFGNWELVFEYCRSEKLKQAFQFVDYIIIHVDTDVSDHPNFDIPKLYQIQLPQTIFKNRLKNCRDVACNVPTDGMGKHPMQCGFGIRSWTRIKRRRIARSRHPKTPNTHRGNSLSSI